MSKVTEEQIENAVNKVANKIAKGVLDIFVQNMDYFRNMENEDNKSKELNIKEICLATLATGIVNCTDIMKETLKELFCE